MTTTAATAISPTTIKLDADTKERMKRLAEARHRTPHWLILDAIRQYVDREEKREAFRQDGIRAWDEYQATGLHVTQDEADAWLGKLEAGQDAEPPECHV
jgi:predicted transcriptional regulator